METLTGEGLAGLEVRPTLRSPDCVYWSDGTVGYACSGYLYPQPVCDTLLIYCDPGTLLMHLSFWAQSAPGCCANPDTLPSLTEEWTWGLIKSTYR
jgi:hypothetical protein